MVDERIHQAEDLKRGCKEYAKAFRLSAHICKSRFPEGDEAKVLAAIFEQKAQLEDDMCRRLEANPIGTLIEEGLA